MLISENYRELNKKLHEARPDYGTLGRHYADIVRQVIKRWDCNTVLDYGCGKRTLEQELDMRIANYDPAIPGLDAPPQPADLVVCTDVLEHVEPEHLDSVLADIRRCTLKVAMLVPHIGPAKKFLDDGRNAHLIQEGPNFWTRKAMEYFQIVVVQAQKKSIMLIGEPL